MSDSAILWIVACQAPLHMGFSRQEYWHGLPCPCPRDLPDPGIEAVSLMSPVLAGGFCTTSATWEAQGLHFCWTAGSLSSWASTGGMLGVQAAFNSYCYEPCPAATQTPASGLQVHFPGVGCNHTGYPLYSTALLSATSTMYPRWKDNGRTRKPILGIFKLASTGWVSVMCQKPYTH